MNCANHPDREKVAFCQNCGKPLCQECTRVVGSAIFCEPCLAEKLAGASAGGNYGYTTPPPATPYAAATGYTPDPGMPPPLSGAPNPGLAGLLGFIPGVGAMYNGQYAKGVVHLIVFAVLVSLTDEHPIFVIFIAGWEFYQAFEAYQTAKARREGTPIPNPFGLNDLGERLGFGKAWTTTGTATAGTTAPGATTATSTPYPAADPSGFPPAQPYSQPYNPPYNPPAAGYTPYTAPGTAWAGAANESYAPPVEPFTQPPFPPLSTRNRVPSGAIWLIALGVIFLIGNAGLFHSFPIHRLLPFFLIGLGVWIFVNRMTATGNSLQDDGTQLYRWRLFNAIRSSIWVVLVGVLFFLDSFNILSWSHSWPLFIIVAGLMTFFRVAYSAPVQPVYPYTPPPAPAEQPPVTSTAIVPTEPTFTHRDQNDQEGR